MQIERTSVTPRSWFLHTRNALSTTATEGLLQSPNTLLPQVIADKSINKHRLNGIIFTKFTVPAVILPIYTP